MGCFDECSGLEVTLNYLTVDFQQALSNVDSLRELHKARHLLDPRWPVITFERQSYCLAQRCFVQFHLDNGHHAFIAKIGTWR